MWIGVSCEAETQIDHQVDDDDKRVSPNSIRTIDGLDSSSSSDGGSSFEEVPAEPEVVAIVVDCGLGSIATVPSPSLLARQTVLEGHHPLYQTWSQE